MSALAAFLLSMMTRHVVSACEPAGTIDITGSTKDNPKLLCSGGTYTTIGTGFISSESGDITVTLNVGTEHTTSDVTLVKPFPAPHQAHVYGGSRLIGGDTAIISGSVHIYANYLGLPYVDFGRRTDYVDLSQGDLSEFIDTGEITKPVVVAKSSGWNTEACEDSAKSFGITGAHFTSTCSQDSQVLVTYRAPDEYVNLTGFHTFQHGWSQRVLSGSGDVLFEEEAADDVESIVVLDGTEVRTNGQLNFKKYVRIDLIGSANLTLLSGTNFTAGGSVTMTILGKDKIPTLNLLDVRNQDDWIDFRLGFEMRGDVQNYDYHRLQNFNHKLITGRDWDCEKKADYVRANTGSALRGYCHSDKDGTTNLYIYPDQYNVFGSETVSCQKISGSTYFYGNTKIKAANGRPTSLDANPIMIIDGDVTVSKFLTDVTSAQLIGKASFSAKGAGFSDLTYVAMTASETDLPTINIGNYSVKDWEKDWDTHEMTFDVDTSLFHPSTTLKKKHKLISGDNITEQRCRRWIGDNNTLRRVWIDERPYSLTESMSSKDRFSVSCVQEDNNNRKDYYSVYIESQSKQPELKKPTDSVLEINSRDTVRVGGKGTVNFTNYNATDVWIVEDSEIIAVDLESHTAIIGYDTSGGRETPIGREVDPIVHISGASKLTPAAGYAITSHNATSILFHAEDKKQLPFVDLGELRSDSPPFIIVAFDVKLGKDANHVLMRAHGLLDCPRWIQSDDVQYSRELFSMHCEPFSKELGEGSGVNIKGYNMIITGGPGRKGNRSSASTGRALSAGAIAGIVIACVVVVAVIIIVVVVVVVKGKGSVAAGSGSAGA